MYSIFLTPKTASHRWYNLRKGSVDTQRKDIAKYCSLGDIIKWFNTMKNLSVNQILKKEKFIALVVFVLVCSFSMESFGSVWDRLRQSMVDEVLAMIHDTRSFTGTDEFSVPVMDSMGEVPRHKFVPTAQKIFSYENRPLAIGYGQTISQPYIVALMTDLLKVNGESTVLEVGTGSGYQAAILSGLVKDVYSIEVVEELAEQAKQRLDELGYDNVHVKHGDGYYGWEEHAPFDGIIVTAVAGQIPPPLIEQLKVNGRMVIPVGTPFSSQYLVLVKKSSEGKVRTQQILPVRFVPLTGEH